MTRPSVYELVESYAPGADSREPLQAPSQRPTPAYQLPTQSSSSSSSSSNDSHYRMQNSPIGYGQPPVASNEELTDPYALPDTWPQSVIPGGVAPTTGGLKRARTRKVKLVQGSVLRADYPVPSAVRNAMQQRYRIEAQPEELSHMSYTAATCDPNDFTMNRGYNLRPRMYNRHTELLITITVFNEDKEMLCRTLHGAMQNVRDICNLRNSQFWNKGGPAWQKIVVCIVVDGLETMDKGILDTLITIGLYQDGIMKKDIDGNETQAHIFEFTTQLSITPNQQLIRPHDDSSITLAPVQMMLCLKRDNSLKINSHRWLFNSFGRLLNPEVVISIDVGTQPGHHSFLNMWQAFFNDKDLGGACGEVYCNLGKGCKDLLNPLTAAQNFEYKISYQLDRALEAAIGYITVLPGAYSAYRFRSIMGRPLEQYFHGDPTLAERLGKKGILGMNLLKKNMYLADDRILCFETVMKAGSKWHLGYVKAAKAETDNPGNMSDFIVQRRRWLNGAFAATVYSVIHFNRIYKSGHNIIRMAVLHVQFVYNIVNFLLSWFSLAGYLLTLFIVNEVSGDPPPDTPANGFPFGKATPIFNAVLQVIYICTIIVQFVLALGTRPRAAWMSYLLSFLIFGLVQIYFLMNVIYLFKRIADIRFSSTNQNAKSYEYINIYYSDIGDLTVIVSGVATFGVYMAVGFLHLDPWHLFTSYAQYLFISSSYTNILNVYAFSNFNDHHWGRKGGHPEPKIKGMSAVTKTSSNQEVTVEEVEAPQADIDSRFEAAVKRALTPNVPAPPDTSWRTLDDDAKQFRIRLIGVYIFTNLFVCVVVLNDSFKGMSWLGDSYWHKIWFFRIWLWANAGCFYFRFAGSCFDLGMKMVLFMFLRR